MNIKYSIYSISLLTLVNCSTQKQSTIDGEITINLNEKVKLANNKTTISFDEIVEDSRCPKDVTCIWEGIATAKVSITENGKKEEFLISSRDFVNNNNKKSFNYDGYRFSFLELNPQPGAKPVPTQLKLKVEVEVEKN